MARFTGLSFRPVFLDRVPMDARPTAALGVAVYEKEGVLRTGQAATSQGS